MSSDVFDLQPPDSEGDDLDEATTNDAIELKEETNDRVRIL